MASMLNGDVNDPEAVNRSSSHLNTSHSVFDETLLVIKVNLKLMLIVNVESAVVSIKY